MQKLDILKKSLFRLEDSVTLESSHTMMAPVLT